MADVRFIEGTADLSPAEPVSAGSPGCWTLVFTVDTDPLPPGAAIRISIPHGFTPPQIDNSDAPGYMVAKTDNPAVDLTVVAVSEDSSGNVADPFTGEDANPGILLFIERAPLKAGDRVTVTYGAGSGRAYASTFAGGAPFRISLCPDGRAYPERFFPLRDSPSIAVRAGDIQRLEVTSPSRGDVGETVGLRVIARDHLGNRCTGWHGWFSVESDVEGVRPPPRARREDPSGEGILLQPGFTEAFQGSGPVRLRVVESERGLEAVSNPILVGGVAPFWGDLHARVPEGQILESVLDFELPVDPAMGTHQTSFQFQTDASPETAAAGTGLLRFSLPDAQSDEMLPSHLLEIYSCWGNREHWGARRVDVRLDRHPDRTVHAVLSQGVIAGFAAGSNSRFGVAGDVRTAESGRGFPAGLTAVYAEALTQEALFAALRERRCYATTGSRILLQIQVSGYQMGQLASVGPEDRDILSERHISVEVHGTARIDRIEIVRNNVEVCTYRGGGENATFQWVDRQDLSRIALPRSVRGGALTCYYFVRVTQGDGEIAWSSPVWFTLRSR